MSKLEIAAGAPEGSPDGLAVGDLLSARYHAEPLLRRMLALGDLLAVAMAAVFVGLWGSGSAAALLLVLSRRSGSSSRSSPASTTATTGRFAT